MFKTEREILRCQGALQSIVYLQSELNLRIMLPLRYDLWVYVGQGIQRELMFRDFKKNKRALVYTVYSRNVKTARHCLRSCTFRQIEGKLFIIVNKDAK